MKNKRSFEDLFFDGLRDMLDGERQIAKALPKMSKKASNPELKKALEKHVSETQEHIERLEKIFALCDVQVRANRCEATQGILREAEEVLAYADSSATCDAAIIAATQKVEHYEMSTYGTLRTFGEVLDFNDAAKLLQVTLDEESNMDSTLNSLASTINVNALEELHEMSA